MTMMASQTASETINSAAAGLSAHLIYQVSARLFSFIIKAVVVRALRPAQFAFVEIRVVLLVTLALLPSIRGFRPVTLRIQSEERAGALALFNALFTFVLGLILGAIAIAMDPDNTVALAIVILSVLIRAFSELPVVFVRRRQRYKEASRARAISIVTSGVSQTVAVSLIRRQVDAAPASSIGHLAYVITLGLTMWSALGVEGMPSLSFRHMMRYLRREDLAMAAVATGEGVIKFLLENGEAIVLDVCTAPVVRGAYKIAANLGSVFARFFSEALEEQAFNVFSRLSGAFQPPYVARAAERRQACLDMLILGLKAAISVSLVFAIVGPRFAYALLRLLYGETWADQTDAPAILSFYLIYVMFMAGNGVSEAFVSASASTSELKARTKFTTTLSVVYMACLYQTARIYGAGGIIFVNCANMTIRTIYSSWFFRKFTGLPFSVLFKALPHYGVIFILIVSRYLASWSENFFFGPSTSRLPVYGKFDMLQKIALHGISGVIALIMFAAALWIFERNFIKQIRSLRSHSE